MRESRRLKMCLQIPNWKANRIKRTVFESGGAQLGAPRIQIWQAKRWKLDGLLNINWTVRRFDISLSRILMESPKFVPTIFQKTDHFHGIVYFLAVHSEPEPSFFLRPVILDRVVGNYFSIKTFLLNFKSEIILSANIIIIFLRIKWFYLFGLRIEN